MTVLSATTELSAFIWIMILHAALNTVTLLTRDISVPVDSSTDLDYPNTVRHRACRGESRPGDGHPDEPGAPLALTESTPPEQR